MPANQNRYTTIAIALHWVTAAIIIYLLVFGEDLIKDKRWLTPVVPASNPGLHASLGFLVLLLTVARIAWRVMNPPPAEVPMPAWQARASEWLHKGFYALMVLIPLSGLAALDRTINGRHPDYANLTFFGLFPIPHFSATWFAPTHDVMTKIAWALLAIHVLAALKHQFLDRDNLLARMKPF